MLLFTISIAAGTFIENDYGTIAARALIFNSWWLELFLLLLCSIFIYNIFQYKLYYPKKLPVLFLHISFISDNNSTLVSSKTIFVSLYFNLSL